MVHSTFFIENTPGSILKLLTLVDLLLKVQNRDIYSSSHQWIERWSLRTKHFRREGAGVDPELIRRIILRRQSAVGTFNRTSIEKMSATQVQKLTTDTSACVSKGRLLPNLQMDYVRKSLDTILFFFKICGLNSFKDYYRAVYIIWNACDKAMSVSGMKGHYFILDYDKFVKNVKLFGASMNKLVRGMNPNKKSHAKVSEKFIHRLIMTGINRAWPILPKDPKQINGLVRRVCYGRTVVTILRDLLGDREASEWLVLGKANPGVQYVSDKPYRPVKMHYNVIPTARDFKILTDAQPALETELRRYIRSLPKYMSANDLDRIRDIKKPSFTRNGCIEVPRSKGGAYTYFRDKLISKQQDSVRRENKDYITPMVVRSTVEHYDPPIERDKYMQDLDEGLRLLTPIFAINQVDIALFERESVDHQSIKIVDTLMDRREIDIISRASDLYVSKYDRLTLNTTPFDEVEKDFRPTIDGKIIEPPKGVELLDNCTMEDWWNEVVQTAWNSPTDIKLIPEDIPERGGKHRIVTKSHAVITSILSVAHNKCNELLKKLPGIREGFYLRSKSKESNNIGIKEIIRRIGWMDPKGIEQLYESDCTESTDYIDPRYANIVVEELCKLLNIVGIEREIALATVNPFGKRYLELDDKLIIQRKRVSKKPAFAKIGTGQVLKTYYHPSMVGSIESLVAHLPKGNRLPPLLPGFRTEVYETDEGEMVHPLIPNGYFKACQKVNPTLLAMHPYYVAEWTPKEISNFRLRSVPRQPPTSGPDLGIDVITQELGLEPKVIDLEPGEYIEESFSSQIIADLEETGHRPSRILPYVASDGSARVKIHFTVCRGTQMGLRLSFPILCLLHQFATRNHPNAVIFGDDLLGRMSENQICDYLGRMDELGFVMNESKTFRSRRIGCFCGTFFDMAKRKHIIFPDIKMILSPKIEKDDRDIDPILTFKEVYNLLYTNSRGAVRKRIEKIPDEHFQNLQNNIRKRMPVHVPEEFGGFGLLPYTRSGSQLSLKARSVYSKLSDLRKYEWMSRMSSCWATSSMTPRVRELSYALKHFVENRSVEAPTRVVDSTMYVENKLRPDFILKKDDIKFDVSISNKDIKYKHAHDLPQVTEVVEPLTAKIMSEISYCLNEQLSKINIERYRFHNISKRALTTLGHLLHEERELPCYNVNKQPSNSMSYALTSRLSRISKLVHHRYRSIAKPKRYVPLTLATELADLLDCSVQEIFAYININSEYDMLENNFLLNLLRRFDSGLEQRRRDRTIKRYMRMLDIMERTNKYYARLERRRLREENFSLTESERLQKAEDEKNLERLMLKYSPGKMEEEPQIDYDKEFPELNPTIQSEGVVGTTEWILGKNIRNTGISWSNLSKGSDTILPNIKVSPITKTKRNYIPLAEYLKGFEIRRPPPSSIITIPKIETKPMRIEVIARPSGLPERDARYTYEPEFPRQDSFNLNEGSGTGNVGQFIGVKFSQTDTTDDNAKIRHDELERRRLYIEEQARRSRESFMSGLEQQRTTISVNTEIRNPITYSAIHRPIDIATNIRHQVITPQRNVIPKNVVVPVATNQIVIPNVRIENQGGETVVTRAERMVVQPSQSQNVTNVDLARESMNIRGIQNQISHNIVQSRIDVATNIPNDEPKVSESHHVPPLRRVENVQLSNTYEIERAQATLERARQSKIAEEQRLREIENRRRFQEEKLRQTQLDEIKSRQEYESRNARLRQEELERIHRVNTIRQERPVTSTVVDVDTDLQRAIWQSLEDERNVIIHGTQQGQDYYAESIFDDQQSLVVARLNDPEGPYSHYDATYNYRQDHEIVRPDDNTFAFGMLDFRFRKLGTKYPNESVEMIRNRWCFERLTSRPSSEQ
jgi:hypothetical protein